MKKLILAAAMLAAGTTMVVAQNTGYNRVGISYDNTNYGFNDLMKLDQEMDGFSTNGVGINYIHGFSLSSSLPMFIETGLNFNIGFGSKNIGNKEEEDGFWMQKKYKFQNINLQVPVNFVYRFNATEDFSISPYVGLNFKLNLASKFKTQIDHNLPDEIMGELDEEDIEWIEGKWCNLFSDSKENMGDKDLTWNRFQMGWHVGVGFQYKPFYLGVQYGTDFIPAYKHKFDFEGYPSETYKVNTGNLKITLGYCF